MIKKILFLLIPLLLIEISGCSSTHSSGEYPNTLGTHYLPWQQRQSQLQTLTNWTVQGVIAIHTLQKGWNASFNWQQQGNNYTLVLFGPLGTNRIQLTGTAGQVVMQTATQTVKATSPDQLLLQETGWDIPISSLTYWIKGLPDTRNPHFGRAFDLDNHIVQLSQGGWHIIYLRYLPIHGIDLPERILLSNQQLQVRIVINRWSF